MKKKLISVMLATIIVLYSIMSCVGCGSSSFSSSLTEETDTSDSTKEGSSQTSSNENPSVNLGNKSSILKPAKDGSVDIVRWNRNNTSAMGDKDSWTIFVYLCGSDLETTYGMAVEDIREMLAANTSNNVRFIVETGGSIEWQDYDISSDNIQRYEVIGSNIKLVQTLDNANMGESQTLSDFLEWGIKEYPAEKMGLIMWNHGGGSITGICFDELNGYDSLSLAEVDQSLATVFDDMTDKFEFIGFDACLMATVETANILVPHAKYMVASQEVEPGYGWDYTAIGEYLTKNPSASGAELGKIIADSFYSSCEQIGEEDNCTMSVVDLSKIDNLIQAINNEATEMYELASDSKQLSEIVRAINNVKSFGGNNKSEGYTNMIDLGALFKATCDFGSVDEAIEEAIVYNLYGANQKGATGLSIYYPLSVQGSHELTIFKEICVSPQYMNFVDRMAYGSSNEGNFDDYSGEDIWLDSENDYWNDYEYWNDYDWEEDDYFDFWEFFDEEDDGGLNFFDDSDTINYLVEPYLNENGTYTFTLDETSLYNTIGVYCSLFLSDPETGWSAELGRDNYVKLDWETGVVEDNFDGIWYALSDGQFLNLSIIEEGFDYEIYTAPILLNGEETNLRVKKDYFGFGHTNYMIGVWNGIEEYGQSSKIMNIQEGDIITPIYYAYDEYGDYVDVIYGDEYVYEGDNKIYYQDLLASDYLYSFEIVDIFGNAYYTDFVTFNIDEFGEIYFYEEW